MTDTKQPAIPLAEPWIEIRDALKIYVAANVELWRDPHYQFTTWRSRKSVSCDTSGPEEARLPISGHLIRGAEGVAVHAEDVDAPVTARVALRNYSMVWEANEAPTKQAEDNLHDAAKALEGVLGKHNEIRTKLYRLMWLREPEDGDQDQLASDLMAIDHLVGRRFDSKGWSLQNAATTVLDDEDITTITRELRDTLEGEREWFRVVALLSGPPIDVSEAVRLFEGQYYGGPCLLEIGYPDDALCAQVFRGSYYEAPPKELRAANAFIQLFYTVPLSEDPFQPHAHARDFLREAVDVLRLLSASDIGLLHFHGSNIGHEFNLLSPFHWIFENERSTVPRVPVRKQFDPPSKAHALNAIDLARLGDLIKKYSVDGIEIRGLPVAMERLRAVYERYAPGELGALVDTVTALEALYLNDGLKDELKFRLQVRIARLLEPGIDSRLQLAKTFSKIYNLRSALVHSGKLSEGERQNAAQLQPEALSILRRTILHMLESGFAVGKSESQMIDEWLRLSLS